MHSVIETHAFRHRAADLRLTEDEVFEIKTLLSDNPRAGDLMPGTGGARKVRIAGRGKGKSGGYRVITFFAADDVPVFLLDIFAKGEKANLSKAEANELKGILKTLAEDWRASVAQRVAKLSERRS